MATFTTDAGDVSDFPDFAALMADTTIGGNYQWEATEFEVSDDGGFTNLLF